MLFASNIPAIRGRMVDAYERTQKRVAPSTVGWEAAKGALAGALIALIVKGMYHLQEKVLPIENVALFFGGPSTALALLWGARGAFKSREWAEEDFVSSVLDAEVVYTLEDQGQRPEQVYEGLDPSIVAKKDQIAEGLGKFFFLKGFRLEESDREGVAVMARRVGRHPDQYGLAIVVPWRGIGGAVPGGLFGHMGFVLRGMAHYAQETREVKTISEAKVRELVQAVGFSIREGATLSEEHRSTEVVAAFLNLASDLGLGKAAVQEVLAGSDRAEAIKTRLEQQPNPNVGKKVELSDELRGKVAEFMGQLNV